MFKLRNGRPSPAAVISLVALVMAMAGTAVALPGKGSVEKDDLAKGAVTKKAIKKGAVTGKAIKKGAVTAAALGAGSVGTAAIGDEAVTGAKVADGSIAAGKLAAGTLPKYAVAFVDTDQAIDQDLSVNMGSATATLDGSFVCFSNLPFAPKTVQVTTVRGGGSTEDSVPQVFRAGEDNGFCDGDEDASVQFIETDGGLDNAPPAFNVRFDG